MASVDGLVSGLNTTEIVQQLMQIERQPQVRLQMQQSTAQKTIDAYRTLSTQFLNVRTAAETLTTGNGWNLAAATSSDAARVAVSAAAGAQPGSLTFTVERLAVAGVSASSGTVTSTSDVVAPAGSTLRLTRGTTETSIDVGDGTLASVVKAINAADAGVTAAAVQTSPGQYKLHLASKATGADSTVTLDDGAGGNPFGASTLGAVAVVTSGQDARLQVGGSAGYTVTRPSNTVSDLLPGVTLTLVQADLATSVTVDVKANAEGTADAVGKMVDAVNAALADIKKQTAYDPATKRAALLTGDGLLRGLQQRLLGAVAGSGTTAAGVSVTRDGTVTFDRTKFLEAFEKDPAGVQAALGGTKDAPGLAQRLWEVADGAARSATAEGGPGQLTSAIKSREDEIRGISSRISSWDNRLALREAALNRQFAALERALGSAQSQGQWLAGQIAGLPSWGS